MRTFLKWTTRSLLLLLAGGFGFALYWAGGQNAELEAVERYQAEALAPGRFVTVDGRRLHVLVKGDLQGDPTGAPMVLLHGFSASGHTTWLPWAEQLAEQRTLVLVDMLNFGYSERITSPDEDLTHQGQAALVNGLTEALGLQRFDLAGWSMGGTIATQFALDYPEKVRAITFVAGHIYGFDRFNPFEMLGNLPFGIGRALSWNSVGGSPNGFVARTCRETGEQCNWLEPLLIENTIDGLRAISATPEITRLPDDIPQIDKPVLVVAGETDTIVPLEDNKKLAEVLDAELFVAPGAGHWPAEQEPERVARRILDFFADQAAKSAARRLPTPPGVSSRHTLTGEY